MNKSLLFGSAAVFMTMLPAEAANPIVANPIELNYQFQPYNPNDGHRREAADPVCEYFNGKYYLFASKSSGYWSSPDLAEWTYIPAPSIPTINDYAPTILILDGEIYFTASTGNTRIFKTATPDDGTSWQEVACKFKLPQHDPSFFLDDDGRLYLYWGCHDKDPIVGVELDLKNDFAPIGEPKEMIGHHIDLYGWEVPGANNEETNHNGYNEGPAMIKYNGKYYLQYAAPGTQWRSYGDGVYVADNPLGPYTYMPDNPFSHKPGGFMGGAGHGHTFKDKYGNYWHVATMCVCQRHWFERRLGLFPVTVDDKGMHAYTLWSDYPFEIPDRKVDFSETALTKGWRQLAIGAKATASSERPDHPAALAADETVETWWSAASGRPGEWLALDLGRPQTVRAVQVNFADNNSEYDLGATPKPYRYVIETSDDGRTWMTVINRADNSADLPHDLIVLDRPVKARHIRIKNMATVGSGDFSLYDLRVFGEKLKEKEIKGASIKRDDTDRRIYHVSFEPVEGAQGYVLYWGIDPDNLTHSIMLRDTDNTLRCFDRDAEYAFRLTSF